MKANWLVGMILCATTLFCCKQETISPNEQSAKLLPLTYGNKWLYNIHEYGHQTDVNGFPVNAYDRHYRELWTATYPALIDNEEFWHIQVTDPATGQETRILWMSNAGNQIRIAPASVVQWKNGVGTFWNKTGLETLFDFNTDKITIPAGTVTYNYQAPTGTRVYSYSFHSHTQEDENKIDFFKEHVGYAGKQYFHYQAFLGSMGTMSTTTSNVVSTLVSYSLN